MNKYETVKDYVYSQYAKINLESLRIEEISHT